MSQPSTLTQEAASSSHRQNNHWQCKVARSQVRWGIEATAIKSTGLQWFSPPFPFPYFVNSCCKTNFHKESKCDQEACVCIVFGSPEGKLWKSSLLRYYGAQKASWLGGLSRKEEAQFNTKRMFGGGGIRHKVNKWANLKRQTVAAVDSFHYLNTWFHFAKKFFRYYVFCPQHDQE